MLVGVEQEQAACIQQPACGGEQVGTSGSGDASELRAAAKWAVVQHWSELTSGAPQ